MVDASDRPVQLDKLNSLCMKLQALSMGGSASVRLTHGTTDDELRAEGFPFVSDIAVEKLGCCIAQSQYWL